MDNLNSKRLGSRKIHTHVYRPLWGIALHITSRVCMAVTRVWLATFIRIRPHYYRHHGHLNQFHWHYHRHFPTGMVTATVVIVAGSIL